MASRAAGTRRLCASAAAALDEALPAAALDAPPLPPQQQHQQQPAAGGGDDALGDAIEAAFLRIFSGPADCPRVLASWRRLRAGDEFARDWPGLGRQQCASYMEGLPEPPPPFPDLSSPGYEWLLEVERSAEIIIEEFERVTANAAALERQGNCVWVPAARADALAYGPDWRTLVLQDRGEWDKFNAKLFPRTRKVIEAANGEARGEDCDEQQGDDEDPLCCALAAAPHNAASTTPQSSPRPTTPHRAPPPPPCTRSSPFLPALPLQRRRSRSSSRARPPAPASRRTPTTSTSSKRPT